MAKVNVYVTLKPSLLDSQGKVVQGALENLGYSNVEAVRIGKYIELEVADGNGKLEQDVDDMCRKLLSNPVIEDYRFEIER
jgi:phosphoribosylformylglycinamidine synthase PurS subunit